MDKASQTREMIKDWELDSAKEILRQMNPSKTRDRLWVQMGKAHLKQRLPVKAIDCADFIGDKEIRFHFLAVIIFHCLLQQWEHTAKRAGRMFPKERQKEFNEKIVQMIRRARGGRYPSFDTFKEIFG